MIIDEGDTFLAKNDELAGILNSGHTRSTAFVIRCTGEDNAPTRFSTFAPIAIAMIKEPQGTLLDRSIVIRLVRKLSSDPVTPVPVDLEDELLTIRQQGLRWAEDNRDQLVGDRELTPADINNDRARDNWTPLMTIAQACGVLEEAQAACRTLAQSEDDSLAIQLLADIRQIFKEEGMDRLPMRVLLKRLVALEEAPWAEYNRGKELTAHGLAAMLREFGIKTRQVRIGAKNVRHYVLDDFKPVFDRYLPKEITPAPPVRTATSLHSKNSLLETISYSVADGTAVASDLATHAAPPEGTGPRVANAEMLLLPAPPSNSLKLKAFQECSDVANGTRGGTENISDTALRLGYEH